MVRNLSQVAFQDAASTPREVAFAHTSSLSKAWQQLGSMALRRDERQQLQHVFRLGAHYSIKRYLRISFLGHVAMHSSGLVCCCTHSAGVLASPGQLHVQSFAQVFISVLIYSFHHSLTHSLTHPSIHPSIRPSVHPSIRPSIHPFTFFTHSFIHSLTHSFIRSFIHSFTHSFTHSVVHLCTFAICSPADQS